MKKKILLISYWVNKQGNSPGIMADDKIYNLNQLGYELVVLSSFDSKKINNKNVTHYRIPSFSMIDFLQECKDKNISEVIKFILYLPIVFSFGIFLDIFECIFLKGKGGGKWFWFVPATIFSLIIRINHRIDFIFTTGGPASAHLAGVLSNIFFKKKLFIELQDPLVGKDIGRSSSSSKYLSIFEKIILKHCYKLVFVTNAAAEECKIRNSEFKFKIKSIYSGAVKLQKYTKNKSKKILNFIHLGTLYTTRNLENLIHGINILKKKNKIDLSKIKILNFGDIYGNKQIKMLDKPYISWVKSTDRLKAIKFCCKSDILLLIQHTDERSKLTFPFKVYEYLNLDKIIFALTNNNELNKMLSKRGHVCADINNVSEISKKLNYILKNKKLLIKKIIKKNKYKINSLKQCSKIFEEI